MRTLTAPALLWAVCLAAACSAGNAQRTQAPGTSTTTPAPVAGTSGYAFTQRDTGYDEVLTQIRSTGRPGLLFFWTSW